MGYRKEDIPGMINALEDAKSRLWRGADWDIGGHRFLCFAIHDDKGIELVQQSIDPHYTFEGWLEAKAGIVTGNVSDAFIQRLRFRWIDKMIADLKDYAK